MLLLIALGTALLLIGIDQLTKWLVIQNIEHYQSISIIKLGEQEILNFTYYRNTGAAFSILTDHKLLLTVLTSVIIIVILFLLLSKRVKHPWMIWSLALILAGGTGNLIDRVTRGFVVDFIDVRIINFAVFNIADICAVIGGIMLFLSVIIVEHKEKNKDKNDPVSETEKSEMEATTDISLITENSES